MNSPIVAMTVIEQLFPMVIDIHPLMSKVTYRISSFKFSIVLYNQFQNLGHQWIERWKHHCIKPIDCTNVFKPFESNDRYVHYPIIRSLFIFSECLQEITLDQLQRILHQMDNISETQMKVSNSFQNDIFMIINTICLV